MELFAVLVLLLIVPINAQDQAFDRNFRRRPSDRRMQRTEARRFPDQRPPEFSVPRQNDRQVDIVPLEQGPFDQRRPRMSQGQMSTSNQAQMDAGGQGEILMQGEIPIPRRMLDAVRQTRGDSSGQGGFNEPRRGSFDGERRRGLDSRRGTGFDRNALPPPPPDTFGGPQRDPQGLGPADAVRQRQFDGSRDRQRGFPSRDRNSGTGPRTFDRRQDPGGNFGPEPRRDRFGRGQMETSNQGSLDVGASANLGLDVQLEGPAQLLDPAGSSQPDSGLQQPGRFDRRLDSTRDPQRQFDRARPDSGQFRDPLQGRLDQTRGRRFDSSNQFEPSRSGSAVRDGRFDGARQGSFDSTRDRGIGPGRFDESRQRQARRDRGFNSGRERRLGAPQEQVGTLRDRRLDPPAKESIGTFPQGQLDRHGGRRPDTPTQVDPSQPGPDVGGVRPGDRFRQGQVEATNKAQIDAAGQGEMLIEGEIQIPTKILKAALKGITGGTDQGSSSGQGQNLVDSTGSLSTARPGQASTNKSGQGFQDLRPGGNIDRQGPGRFDESQQGQGGFGSSGNIDRQGTGGFDGSQQGQGGFGSSGNIDRQGPGRFDGSQGGLDSSGTGRIDGSQQRPISSQHAGNNSSVPTGEPGRSVQGPTDPTVNQIGATSEPTVPGRLDKTTQDPIKDPLAALLCKLFYYSFP